MASLEAPPGEGGFFDTETGPRLSFIGVWAFGFGVGVLGRV